MEKQLENIKFKKQFGQNFITDTNLLKAICNDASITKDDEVLEIGVGAGTLTKELCLMAKKVVSYEIDTSLKPFIEQNTSQFDNFKIIYGDFLKQENVDIKLNFESKFKVVANLPYYITTPIIFKILEGEFNVKSLTVMVQKEVAERLISKENTKDYGVLTVMVQAISDVSIARIVKRNMFTPMPNVDSAICHMVINREKFNILNKELFKKVVNSAFGKRRKIFMSNLKNDLGFIQQDLENIFNKLNINLMARGETLSVEKFVELSNELFLLKGDV